MKNKLHQPLSGKRIAITRANTQASELNEKLTALGAEVIELPLIHIERELDPDILQDVFKAIATYEWIIFTSPNGVRHFMEIFLQAFKDIRAIGPARFACIGKSTAKELEAYHLVVDLVPAEPLGESLAEALIATGSLDSANVLIVTGNRNRDMLSKTLEGKGRAIVDTLQVYRTDFTDLSQNLSAELFRKEGADAITFTSSSTAESFIAQAKHLQIATGGRQPKTVSIGSITSATMKAKGIPVNATAETASLDSLVQAVIHVLGK